jgi:hypothetical protein
VLGNPRVLSKQPLWHTLLAYFKEHGCLVEGPLTNLKQCLVQLHRPQRAFDKLAFGNSGTNTSRCAPPARRCSPAGPTAPGLAPASLLPCTGRQARQPPSCLPCPALPCPALPCPALPCPALPCPALPSRHGCSAPLPPAPPARPRPAAPQVPARGAGG